MKYLGLACLAVGLIVVAGADERYTTKYDNVNLDEILNNERLFKTYFNCLIDKGSCTPDAAVLKKLIIDALDTECSKCSDKQKAGSEKVMKFLIEKKPTEYTILEKKYDPQGAYKKKYEGKARKLGIKIPAKYGV